MLPAARRQGTEHQAEQCECRKDEAYLPENKSVWQRLAELETEGEKTDEGESGSQRFTFQGQQVLLFGGIHFHFDPHFRPKAYGG